ncbi:hypothetical protein ACX122_07785 [Kosakonia cowanii]|uniref:Fumarase D n=1 Tax=Enterobacter cloacae S611 TaxID=1399146 RepID=A0ABN0Q907_ENTCL|nr:hypothetical protein [Kosakonia sp. HypNH10]ESS58506.1 hypothetical protein EDP2_1743 [Enterobacter cloacae S611]MDH2912330.1 hypothetical protein [Kosakonia sp. HypNH10]
MDIISSERVSEVYMVIGHAVSSLISAGKRVEKEGILEQLQKGKAQAVDGMNDVYESAIRLVASEGLAVSEQ